MARGIEILASVPQRQRDHTEALYSKPTKEVEGLRALRRIAGKAQADVAAALKIKQPSVSKIENRADMHISTLRSYVEAVGGKLELTVRLPKHPALRIHAISDPRSTFSANLAPRRTSLATAGHADTVHPQRLTRLSPQNAEDRS
ncbi:helix-turn-helix domain-containing protein [Mesorhizobium neociceri]|uniref:XRE family transcriptional regulator n=1 Tax=Mesorhizobium neociceri TaxID=1307853 RepID=A0A838BAZ7_9HYPH|nr:XRE family transcriptional regulator [Mesorhizobium neociceri]MBA1143848.1 XRE family transcriptional regulator [Mesorhizobium neociceri]